MYIWIITCRYGSRYGDPTLIKATVLKETDKQYRIDHKQAQYLIGTDRIYYNHIAKKRHDQETFTDRAEALKAFQGYAQKALDRLQAEIKRLTLSIAIADELSQTGE